MHMWASLCLVTYLYISLFHLTELEAIMIVMYLFLTKMNFECFCSKIKIIKMI